MVCSSSQARLSGEKSFVLTTFFNFVVNCYITTQCLQKNNSAIIRGLTPFTKYLFKVELVNSADRGSVETGVYTAQTAEGGAVGSLAYDELPYY